MVEKEKDRKGKKKRGTQIYECCPPTERSLCRGEDSGACREAEDSQQEQVDNIEQEQ